MNGAAVFATGKRLLAALLLVGGARTVLSHPGSGIAVDRRGDVYFIDTGSGVWKIGSGDKLVRHGGPRFHWMALDEGGRPARAPVPTIPGGEITPVGTNPTVLVSSDVPLAVGKDGSIYYPEKGPEGEVRIKRFTRSGVESVYATLQWKARRGVARWINGLVAEGDGSLYYTEDDAVRRVDEHGAVSTIAADVVVPGCIPIAGTPGERRPYLRGLSVDKDGTVFAAAAGCGAVVKITSRGETTVVLRTESPWSPTAVAVSPRGLYVLEYLHTDSEDRLAWVPRVRKALPDGRVVNVAVVGR